jgi:hypothetical protein
MAIARVVAVNPREQSRLLHPSLHWEVLMVVIPIVIQVVPIIQMGIHLAMHLYVNLNKYVEM